MSKDTTHTDDRRVARFFRRGLKALLPTFLTLFVVLFAFNFVVEQMSRPVARAASGILGASEWGRSLVGLVPGSTGGELPGWVGFVLLMALTFVLGVFLTGFLGRRLFAGFERLVRRIPVLGRIYPSAQQIVGFFTDDSQMGFQSVVAIPYPRKDIYTVGFATSPGMESIDEQTGCRRMGVFVPTSPTPFTGFLVWVRVEEVLPIPMTMDEALRMTVSGGVLLPDPQRVDDPSLGVAPPPPESPGGNE